MLRRVFCFASHVMCSSSCSLCVGFSWYQRRVPTFVVTVQVPKLVLSHILLMPYYRSMATHSPLPPEIWDRTPREAQEYILALKARVASLEATVQDLLERLQQDSRT